MCGILYIGEIETGTHFFALGVRETQGGWWRVSAKAGGCSRRGGQGRHFRRAATWEEHQRTDSAPSLDTGRCDDRPHRRGKPRVKRSAETRRRSAGDRTLIHDSNVQCSTLNIW